MKIEVSLGEVLDRKSILTLKLLNISDPGKLANIRREQESVEKCLRGLKLDKIQLQITQLHEVNKGLWEVEDKLRAKESSQTFDGEFIELARSVYKLNDRRYNLKREINLLSGSTIMEEKQYSKY